METLDIAFALGDRFKMVWGKRGELVFVVIDRMHTDRGNMYWLQTRDRPKFTELFQEAHLETQRRLKTRKAVALNV
jgi:hypothetical protein